MYRPLTTVLLFAGIAHAQLPSTRPAEMPPLTFRTITICDDFPSAYHCAVADLNKDNRPDILVLGEPPGGVDWFENPGKPDAPWKRHILAGKQTEHNIDLAVQDIDRDGNLDVAIASDFLFGDSQHDSLVQWFHRSSNNSDEWKPERIYAIPTAHRIRWGDLDGDGRNELITVPVIGRGAKAPSYQQATVPITAHWVPKHPMSEPWPEKQIDNSLTVTHGACAFDWNNDGQCDLLIASNEGISLFITQGRSDDMRWTRRKLTAGHKGEAPNQGSSEIEVGKAPGRRFLAAIEPWHGTEVVVYMPPDGGNDAPGDWHRQVIDDSFQNGHALACADLDADGTDEIVAGYRGEGTSLYVYRLVDVAHQRWARLDLDKGGIAAQGCTVADINGDGRLDIVAVGGNTHNARLYVNETEPLVNIRREKTAIDSPSPASTVPTHR